MQDLKQDLEYVLSKALGEGASDLHLSVGRYPTLRIDGSLVPLTKEPVITPERGEALADALMNPLQKERFAKDLDVDFSYDFREKARFRVNIFHQRGFVGAALRLIPTKIRTLEELNLPPVLGGFTRRTQGFLLVVGPAGHGKSTTLAALVDQINHTRDDHIITIEDPIEYIFTQDRCIVSQRELFHDTTSFSRGLRAALREDPDVIMVGEMRDLETMATALTAAETGHLVFATLHTNNASQTIDRIIDSFPAAQQGQVRSQLSSTILGIASERLIPKIDGGRVPAVEIMIANSAIRNLIREKKTHEIDLVIETSADAGMIKLNRSLADLVKNGDISLENAEIYSLNQEELRTLLQK